MQQVHRQTSLDRASPVDYPGFPSCDLLDLNGTDVRNVSQDTVHPADSTVTYCCENKMTFAEIARFIPCFTPQTIIATPDGERRAQDLQIGDRVLTRDNGLQSITWAGHKTMTMRGLALTDDMRPIRIAKDAFGPDCPARDMVVSPNHRMLTPDADLGEVLVPAKHLTHLPGVTALKAGSVTYIHFMCDRHEIVFSNGLWTETFQPNDDALRGIDAAQRRELFGIFPELANSSGRHGYGIARQTVTPDRAAA